MTSSRTSRRRHVGRLWIGVWLLVLTPCSVFAAAPPERNVTCGEIVEGEFRIQGEHHRYLIPLEATGKLKLRVVPVGSYLTVRARVYDPVATQIAGDQWPNYYPEENYMTGTLSADGIYTVVVDNKNTVGQYIVYVGCILKDGKLIEAGTVTGGSTLPVLNSGIGPAANSSSPGSGLLTDLEAVLGDDADEVRKVQGYTRAAKQTLEGATGVVKAAKGFFSAFRGGKKQPKAEQPQYVGADATPGGAPPNYAQPVEGLVAAPSPLRAGQNGGAEPAATDSGGGFQARLLLDGVFPRFGLGMPLEGDVAPGGDPVGCRFLAEAGEKVSLTFERVSGDPTPLHLLVLDPYGEVAFETQLRGNPRLAVTLELATRGEYTAGVAVADPHLVSSRPARFRLGMKAAR